MSRFIKKTVYVYNYNILIVLTASFIILMYCFDLWSRPDTLPMPTMLLALPPPVVYRLAPPRQQLVFLLHAVSSGFSPKFAWMIKGGGFNFIVLAIITFLNRAVFSCEGQMINNSLSLTIVMYRATSETHYTLTLITSNLTAENRIQ